MAHNSAVSGAKEIYFVWQEEHGHAARWAAEQVHVCWEPAHADEEITSDFCGSRTFEICLVRSTPVKLFSSCCEYRP